MSSLDAFASDKLAALEKKRLRRTLQDTGRGPAAAATRGAQEMISFCCNDYLGLSQNNAVKQAAAAALAEYGAGAGASRLVTGNHPLYDGLEASLAALKGTEDACVFGSGYLANIGTIPTLVGADDVIFTDSLNHACLHTGAKLSGAPIHLFRHNDMADLSRLITAHRSSATHALILTEGVFSMDGDRAPLAELCDLADAHDAWLMVDDAHGLGVLGNGSGSAAEAGVSARIPLHMGTLSKAVGSYGGFVAASKPVTDLLKTRARSLVYTTGLPPSVIAGATAAIDIIRTDPALCASPLEYARRFTGALGLPVAESPIVPLVLGDTDRALAASEALAAQGFLVTAIRPPTVPDGTARLRFTFSAMHDETMIDRLAAAIRALGLMDARAARTEPHCQRVPITDKSPYDDQAI